MTARITVTGNAVTAPQIRVTKTGRRVANFRIGSTERYQERSTGEWVDGNTFYVSVACWGALADNVEVSVRLGMAVVVTGKISQRTYTDSNDKTQFAYEIQADTVAPDLTRGTAVFTKTSRTTGPPVGVDDDGQAKVGVAEDPFERADGVRVGHDDDAVTITTAGGFRGRDGLDLPLDDGSTPERDDAELVGAAS